MTKRKVTWGDVFLPFISFLVLIYFVQYMYQRQVIINETEILIQEDTIQRPDVDTYHMNKTEVE